MYATQGCEFETIDATKLAGVAGGNNGGESVFRRGLRLVGRGASAIGKVTLPIRAAVAGYDAVTGFVDARRAGRSVTESLRDAGQNVASGQTFGLIPRPR
jgi:hypothetical protein